MAVLLITTRGSYVPDDENLGNWEKVHDEPDFYTLKVGKHRVFVCECIGDEWKTKKTVMKHNEVASWIDIVMQYEKENSEHISSNDIYAICHDKDLVTNFLTDEGIFPESEVLGNLKGKIQDRHIYVFQHVFEQDMYKAIIRPLPHELTESNIDQAIAVIQDCTYEVSNS